MTYTELNLSTATLYGETVYAGGVIGDGSTQSDFSFASFQMDPTGDYEIQVDIIVPAGWSAPTVTSFSLLSLGSRGFDFSNGYVLAAIPIPTSGTYTLATGASAGTVEWDRAVTAGEMGVTFEARSRLTVTGLRWQAATSTPDTSIGTDTSYANDSYTYGGAAAVDYAAPAAPAPPGVVRQDVRRVHQSLPTPTLVKGRPQ